MNELGFATLRMFGGNSPCVQIDTGSDDYLVCDLGSGARAFAQHMMRTHGPAKKQPCHFDMQWDYIMGFALFAPIYIPGNRVIIYGCHEELEAAFRAAARAAKLSGGIRSVGLKGGVCHPEARGSRGYLRPKRLGHAARTWRWFVLLPI